MVEIFSHIPEKSYISCMKKMKKVVPTLNILEKEAIASWRP
jgi:hypothetical protein